MNFQQAKKSLAKLAKGEYHSIRYEINEYRTGNLAQECSVYIEGRDWISGLTWDEALKKMKFSVNKTSVIVEEIEELKL